MSGEKEQEDPERYIRIAKERLDRLKSEEGIQKEIDRLYNTLPLQFSTSMKAARRHPKKRRRILERFKKAMKKIESASDSFINSKEWQCDEFEQFMESYWKLGKMCRVNCRDILYGGKREEGEGAGNVDEGLESSLLRLIGGALETKKEVDHLIYAQEALKGRVHVRHRVLADKRSPSRTVNDQPGTSKATSPCSSSGVETDVEGSVS